MMSCLKACDSCGLVHSVAPVPANHCARCTRCRSVIPTRIDPDSSRRTAAITLVAVILYPFAITTPIMTLERMGHESVASVWSGTIGLLNEGHYATGLTVLFFSIVAPIVKLTTLLVLSLAAGPFPDAARAVAFRSVELIGRWGMLDVMLVAVLVAVVKLGDLVEVTPGPGVVVFGLVVVLSIFASMAFDPRSIWSARSSNARVAA